MTNGEALECTVLERLSLQTPVSLEELLDILPGHSWNQLFAAIDSLSRRGAITLRRVDRCTYHISLGPQFEAERVTSSVGDTSSSEIYS
jgi:hypothetical protein